VCQSENFQRAALIYESGSQVSTSVGIGVAYAGHNQWVPGAMVTGSHHQTALAARLAPPEQQSLSPAMTRRAFAVICFLVGGFFLSIGVSLASKQPTDELGRPDRAGFVCVGIFALPPLLLGAYLWFKASEIQKTVTRHNDYVYPRLYDQWLRLFVCMRCGHAWDWGGPQEEPPTAKWMPDVSKW
jgi:hypothetical protein